MVYDFSLQSTKLARMLLSSGVVPMVREESVSNHSNTIERQNIGIVFPQYFEWHGEH